MMARGKSITIRDTLANFLPKKRISSIAVEVGAVIRERKIDIVAFAWTLILGFTAGSERTIAGLRRSYELVNGVKLAPSSFYDRFTPRLVKLLRALVDDVIDSLVPRDMLKDGVFSAFRDVLAIDSTVLRLHALLAKRYAACRTNHTKAAAKLHTIINVLGRGIQKVKITCERVHDGPALTVGPWVRGRLLIFDLGYYCFSLFARIDGHGGYFLSRLKEGANPIITAVHVGGKKDLIGQHLKDVIGCLRRQVIEFEVEVRYKHRLYRGKRRGDRARFRLVGIRNKETKRYHFYLTNIPIETVCAKQIAALYSARWTVELLFRELKKCYRIDDLPSYKPQVVESLIYASILTLAASRRLYALVAKRMKQLAHRMPEERWAVVFTNTAEFLLLILACPRLLGRFLSGLVLKFMCHEAIDPNATRKLLLKRVLSVSSIKEAA